MWNLRWFLCLGCNWIKTIYMPYILWHVDVRWPEWNTLSSSAVGRAKCKYWRYGWKTDHGKHVLEGSGTAFPIPLTPFYGSCVTRLHTRACLCCEHTITIHHRAAHTPSFWPGWVRILSLASLRTWVELLFASGNLDNLNVACSGLSKTTVLCWCSTHTPVAHRQLLFHSSPFLACDRRLTTDNNHCLSPFLSSSFAGSRLSFHRSFS